MANITLKGEPIHTAGSLPSTGNQAPDFTLTGTDLAEYNLSSFQSGNIVMNIFPSLDTSVCSATVREFNQRAAEISKGSVLCISMDLPFAQQRFCGAEGIERVTMLSAFRHPEFGEAYGVKITDGPIAGLLARSVLVVDANGTVKHSELVPEIAQEPDYDAALKSMA